MADLREIELEYLLTDHDAEDRYVFNVASAPKGALSMRWRLEGTNDGGGPEIIAASALESAAGVFVISQGERAGEREWCPPFVVPSAVLKKLAKGGRAELRTGFMPDEPLAFERAEADQLSEDAARVVETYAAPVIAGRAGDREIVMSQTEPAQLLWLRADDACTVGWRSGRIEAKAAKVAKAAAAQTKKSAKAASPLDDLQNGSAAKRIAAAKKLASATDAASIEALLEVGTIHPDYKVRGPVFQAFRQAREAAAKSGAPHDLVPLLRTRLATVPDFDGTHTPELQLIDRLVAELSTEKNRAEVLALYREIAWQHRLDSVSGNAASMLVSWGDAESVERASHLLGSGTFDIAAIASFFRLPAEIGSPRARAQFDGASDEKRRSWAPTFFHSAKGASGTFLELLADVASFLNAQSRRLLSEWVVGSKVIENGRRDAAAAAALLSAHYWDVTHDALFELIPTEALDADVADALLGLASRQSSGLDAAFARMPTGLLTAALRAQTEREQGFTIPYPVSTALLARRQDDASLLTLLADQAKIAEQRGNAMIAHTINQALTGV